MSEGNDKYVKLIRDLIPISDLPPQSQLEIVNSGKLLNVRKKGTLFNQGDRDNFSFYLLEGEIELHANDQQQNSIVSGSDRALYAMAQLQPRQFSAKAKVDSVVFQIQRDALDRLMVMQQKDDPISDVGMDDDSSSVEISQLDDEEDVDWMTRMLQSELFASLPTANIGQLFALLEEVPFRKGENVIKQGDPGDKYYIIQSGTCHVLRTPPSGGKDLKLAELSTGDSFGEEALVSESIRNATVAMATDGILTELSKENFIELIKKPTLQSVSYEQATEIISAGGAWLDVRFKKEHDSHAIPDSLHIPLNILRMQADKLDLTKQYIAYCDTGGRSSTAAFLLTERGFSIKYLEGGIVNNPDAADSSEVTQIPPSAAKPAPEPAPKPVAKEEKAAAPSGSKSDAIDEISKQNMDPDIKASVLEAELTRTNMELEKVEKAKKQADISVQEAQAAVEKQLQEERKKIELAKKQAEEALKLRQQEEEKMSRMKEDAEQRLQEEKKQLEEVYNRNAEEMEKVERMKAEAEELVKQEKERLALAGEEAKQRMAEAEALKKEMEASRVQQEEEAKRKINEAEALKKEMEASRLQQDEEAKRKISEAESLKKEVEAERAKESQEAEAKMAEAQKMKAEVEAARAAMEKAALETRKMQEEMEKQIQETAKIKLDAERRKLSEEFAKNHDELEQAKREKAEAEAGRQAAKEEAVKIIAEYKMSADQSHAEEQEKLKAEREKLEEEQRKIQATLAEVQQARQEAEAAKEAALKQVEELRSKQTDADATTTQVQQKSISEELKQAEQEASAAALKIVNAQQAEVKAVAAKNINAVDLEKKKVLEEELRKAMEADLSQFRHERDEEDAAYANSNTIMEKMRRIKEKAEHAKQSAKENDAGLLDDIAGQLGGDD